MYIQLGSTDFVQLPYGSTDALPVPYSSTDGQTNRSKVLGTDAVPTTTKQNSGEISISKCVKSLK